MTRSIRASALLVFAFSLLFTLCTGRAAIGDPLSVGSVAGDFNADGRLDVLVQPADAKHPGRIVLRDGTGALSVQVQVIDASFLGLDWVRSDSTAFTGDFDGDGRADVLLQSKQSGGVQALLLTDATSELNQVAQKIPANYMGVDWSAAAHQLVIGDFNGDGRSDVLLQAVNSNDINLIVSANAQGQLDTTGQGWMQGYLGRDWSANDVQLYTGDFNGDGKTDLLLQARAGHSPGGQSDYALITADANGQFTQVAQTWNAGDLGADWSPAIHTLSVRDINGDGIADIVLTSSNGQGSNYAFLGNRSGVFVKPAVTWKGNMSAEDALRQAEGNGQITIRTTNNSTAAAPATSTTLASPQVSTLATTNTATTGNTTVGTLNGQSGVNGGAASYSIPITVPPGRAGMQPSLSLNYSSKGGNGDLGMGWSLGGLSAISRCPETMAQDGRNRGVTYSVSADRLCLDGQRLIAVSGTYGQSGSIYRTELDSNVQVKLSGGDINSTSSEFEVDYSNGNKAYYGNSSTNGSATFLAGGESVPLEWAINEIVDPAGNNITYTYSSAVSRGEHHILGIVYSSTSNPSNERRVAFGYTTRSDASSSYLAGGLTMETKVLTGITTYIGVTEFRQYTLAYGQSAATDRSLLQSVQECGFDAGGSELCYAPTTFSWQDPLPQFAPVHLGIDFGSNPAYTFSTLNIARDYSGTGVSDLIYMIGGSSPDSYILQADTTPQIVNHTDEDTLFGGAQNFSTTSPINQNTQDADFNDDGAADIIGTVGNQVEIAYSNHDTPVTFQNPVPAGIPTSQVTRGMVTGDFTGNGLNDIIAAGPSPTNSTDTSLYLYVNQGPGASPQFKLATNQPQPFITLTGFVDSQGNSLPPSISAFGDLDGNGIPDFSEMIATTAGIAYEGVDFLTRNSSGVLQATFRSYAQMGISSSSLNYVHEFMDINGDGLKDLVYYDTSTLTWHYQLNQGNQTFSAAVDTGSNLGTAPYQLHGLIVADVRNDGHDDLLFPDEVAASWCDFKKVSGGTDEIDVCDQTLLSGSMSYLDNSIYHYRALTFDEASNGTFIPAVHDYGIYAKHDSLSGDVNGDGLNDLFYSIQRFTSDGVFDTQCGTECSNGAGPTVEKQVSAAPDLMTGVTNGLGAKASWQYNSLAQLSDMATPRYTESSCGNSAQDFCFSSSMYVVSQYKFSNSAGNLNTHTYSYQDAVYNTQGRGFQGFAKITDVFTPAGGLAGTTTVRTYNDASVNFPLFGTLLEEKITATSTGDVLSDVTDTWESAHPNDCLPSQHVFWQQLKESDVEKYGASGEQLSSTITNYVYDNDGNATNIDSKITDATGTFETTTANNYAPDCAAWWPDKFDSTNSKTVTSTVTYSGAYVTPALPASALTTVPRVADYSYNSLRKVSEQRNDPDTAYEKDTTYGFDSYGNPNSVTVSSGAHVPTISAIASRTVSTDYTGTDGYLAGSITNAAGQTATIVPDLATGEPDTVTAPDGVVTSYSYDSLGRKISEAVTSPRTLPATVISYDAPAAVCAGTPVTAVYSVTTTHAGSPSHTVCYDALNELLRSATDSFSNGVTSIQDTRYDNLGRVTQTSEPYLSTETVTYWNKVDNYDVLNRVTEKTDAEGVDTAYVYTGLTTTTTTTPPDRPTLSTKATDNALGKLLSTQDPNGSVTQFRYDVQGNPVLIKDAAGNQTVAVYNLLGQKTDVTDPDMGHSSYIYDILGNLVQQTDAKNQSITQTYDVLNRIKSRTAPDKSAVWMYDTCTNGVGKLCSVTQTATGASAPDYVKNFTYDILGRPTQVGEQVNGGTTYITTTLYDSDGRVDTVKYPASVTDTPPTVSASAIPVGANGIPKLATLSTGTLQGTATDPDGPEPLGYKWSLVSQSPASGDTHPTPISNPGSATTSFTAGDAGYTDTFELTVNDGLLSSTSDVNVQVSPGKPGTLSLSSATSSTGAFDVYWGAATGATSYRLFQVADGATVTRGYTSSPASLSGIGSHTSNITYGYYVEGCNNSICGDPGNTATVKVSLPPTGPTSISVPSTSNADGSFTISWSGTTGVVTTARVALGLKDTSTGTVMYTEGFCTSNSTDPTVETPTNAPASCRFPAGTKPSQPGYPYFVDVTACNLGACAAPVQASGHVAVVITPGTPTLSASALSVTVGGSVKLSWTAPARATSYILQASTTGTNYNTAYSGTALSVTKTLSVAGDHYFRVEACNTTNGVTNCGAWSNVKDVYAQSSGGGGGLKLVQAVKHPVATSVSTARTASVISPVRTGVSTGQLAASTKAASVLSSGSRIPGRNVEFAESENLPAQRTPASPGIGNPDGYSLSNPYRFAPPVYQYYSTARIEPASVTATVVRFQVQYQYTSTGYLKAITNAVSGRMYWQAGALTAQGQIAQETYGNGVMSTLSHDDPMSRITEISNSVQNLNYAWDSLGNLSNRSDLSSRNLNENFSYDKLNRLTGSVLTNGTPSSPISTSYSYDALGNITCKSDVVGHDCVADPTGYSYGSGAGPHAVTSITGTSAGTYQYDADGNMINRDGTVITWNSDNLPTSIVQDVNNSSTFSYAPDKHRYEQTALINGISETTVYMGDYEEVTKAGVTTYRHHLSAYGREVAEVDLANSGGLVTEKVSYIFTDHLGSVDVVMSPSGNTFESFGAFGKRRDVTTWQAPLGSTETQADHDADRYGFTHQEMLDNVALIHMNGRVYDPNLGRFLSVDPAFQFPTNTQSLNPYSYVLNNPLSLTDPTGYTATGDCKMANNCGNVTINDGWGGSLGRGGAWWNDGNGVTAGQRSDQSQHAPDGDSNIGNPSTGRTTGDGSSGSKSGTIKPDQHWVMEYSSDGKTVKFTLEDSNSKKVPGTKVMIMHLSGFKHGAEFQLLSAIKYDESGGWGVFRELAASGHDTEIQPTSLSSSGGDAGTAYMRTLANGHHIVPSGAHGVIWIDPTSGLRVSGGGVQSAAIGFGHEAEHVLEAIRNPDQFIRDLHTTVNGYNHGTPEESNLEEQRVIRGPESIYAKKLGEPTRLWHDGSPVPEDCSTCRN